MNLSFPCRAALVLSFLTFAVPTWAQTAPRDQAVYKERPLLDREKEEQADRDRCLAEKRGVPCKSENEAPKKRLTLDFSKLERPKEPGEFKQAWHQPPIRQWWTNTCWCFSTTSFLESEIHRQTGKEIKLSEMFTVYWEYVERAREFVRTKGASVVDEGSESEAVILRAKKYGLVRESDYSGLAGGYKVPEHQILVEEVRAYLEYVKKGPYWDEATVVAGVRAILDKHLGRPPEKIAVDGKDITPLEFLHDVLKLDLDGYVSIMSFLNTPFWSEAEYAVPDNWWHGKSYINVPLADWYQALRDAAAAGYTIALAGDVSEPGYEGAEDVAIVPTFDIPGEFIDQSAREFRFSNNTTQDDHGIHVVGFLRKGDHDWFLVKDSSRSGQRGAPGYIYYREDYVKLKMLAFMVHKDAVKPLLDKYAAARQTAEAEKK
jgi:bleomycin hydrolase